MEVRRLFDPDRLYRVDPLGYVRSGKQILDEWNPETGASLESAKGRCHGGRRLGTKRRPGELDIGLTAIDKR